MPIPVKSNCSTRSMETLGYWKLIGSAVGDCCCCRRPKSGWIDQRNARAAQIMTDAMRIGPSPSGGASNAGSIVEVDMLVVNDRPLLVLHDVVAVQTVAVLVKIVFAFGTGVFLDSEDGLTDFCRVGRAGLVDRSRQDGDGVIRPGALVIRRSLVGVTIRFAEGLGRLAGVFRVIR